MGDFQKKKIEMLPKANRNGGNTKRIYKVFTSKEIKYKQQYLYVILFPNSFDNFRLYHVYTRNEYAVNHTSIGLTNIGLLNGTVGLARCVS